jgi:hypothetical protein
MSPVLFSEPKNCFKKCFVKVNYILGNILANIVVEPEDSRQKDFNSSGVFCFLDHFLKTTKGIWIETRNGLQFTNRYSMPKHLQLVNAIGVFWMC